VKPSIRDEMSSLSEWSGRAACRSGHPPVLWDTIRVNDSTSMTPAVAEAKETCIGCPVMLECLIHGIVFEKTDQVWGGLTDEERVAWAEREGLVPA
jgi:WhiB family redox-sensing transcriptional regulator